MLQSLKHRGPDSTGFALYGKPARQRVRDALQGCRAGGHDKGFDIHRQVKERRAEVDARLGRLGAQILERGRCHRIRLPLPHPRMTATCKQLADYVEDVEGAEILSIGHGLELIKDLGDADQVARPVRAATVQRHARHRPHRMATESDVDIRSAHPYWAYPFNDISVVHNGQLTNYWVKRRALERKGHRFVSNCDSELIAVYLADKMDAQARRSKTP